MFIMQISMIKTKFVEYKILLQNCISLFTLQGLNYILPLVTIPYLLRILGPDKYGTVLFVASFVTYFQILTDYGFNLSATRNISLHKDNGEKVSEIFSSVIVIKGVLCLVSFIILSILTLSIMKFRVDYYIYLISFIMVIGNALFPIWFFQGIEKMKYITYINIIAKSIFTILIFFIIKKSDDYIKLILLNSLSALSIGIYSFIFVLKKFDITFLWPSIRCIEKEFKDGWYIFTTSMLSSTLTNSGVFILGIFTSKEIVGYYGAIDKLVKAFIGMFAPITQAIFPHISSKFKISYKEGKQEVFKFGKYVMLMTIFVASIMFLFHEPIVLLICSSKYLPYSNILKYMSFWLILSVLNNFIGIQYLIGTGNGKCYSKCFTISAVVTMSIYLLLVNHISYYAIIAGTIVGELTLTISMIIYIKIQTV